ncbi:MAG: hypothetical protein RSD88_08540 [Anaerovoracaceae bacterium]
MKKTSIRKIELRRCLAVFICTLMLFIGCTTISAVINPVMAVSVNAAVTTESQGVLVDTEDYDFHEARDGYCIVGKYTKLDSDILAKMTKKSQVEEYIAENGQLKILKLNVQHYLIADVNSISISNQDFNEIKGLEKEMQDSNARVTLTISNKKMAKARAVRAASSSVEVPSYRFEVKYTKTTPPERPDPSEKPDPPEKPENPTDPAIKPDLNTSEKQDNENPATPQITPVVGGVDLNTDQNVNFRKTNGESDGIIYQSNAVLEDPGLDMIKGTVTADIDIPVISATLGTPVPPASSLVDTMFIPIFGLCGIALVAFIRSIGADIICIRYINRKKATNARRG